MAIPTRDDVGYFPTYSMEIRDNTASSPEAMEAARRLREHFITYTTLVDAKVCSNLSLIIADADESSSWLNLTKMLY
jgi:hypothetical protein